MVDLTNLIMVIYDWIRKLNLTWNHLSSPSSKEAGEPEVGANRESEGLLFDPSPSANLAGVEE